MQYRLWAQEYLEEAARVKEKVAALRQSAKDADIRDLNELNRRIGTLYTMYLELRDVGNLLLNHPQRRYDREEPEEERHAP